jgi:hypothetical protein
MSQLGKNRPLLGDDRMAAHQVRTLLLAAVLAAVAAPALANDAATTQQSAVGQALADAGGQAAAPAVAQESFIAETNGRSATPLPARDRARNRQASARHYAAAARRSCAHLGCRGGHALVLGVGY